MRDTLAIYSNVLTLSSRFLKYISFARKRFKSKHYSLFYLKDLCDKHS